MSNIKYQIKIPLHSQKTIDMLKAAIRTEKGRILSQTGQTELTMQIEDTAENRDDIEKLVQEFDGTWEPIT